MGIRFFLLLFCFSSAVKANYRVLSTDNIESVHLQTQRGVDFNKDQVKDYLRCQGNEITVRDGKNWNRLLLKWRLPNGTINHPSYRGQTKVFISACKVARIKMGHPSIIISSAYSNPAVGARSPAVQYILFNRGEGSRGGLLRASPQALVVNQDGRRFHFKTVSRGVKCQDFPQDIVDRGFNPGVLCFYAGYDGALSRGGYGTSTALLKLEEGTNGQVVAIDLTQDSNLPWTGGALGTPMDSIPLVRIDNGPLRFDGLHMMDGAFLDYNQDGLPDLVTVGQHASIRLATMEFDPNTDEGISFQNSIIHQAGRNTMTEFLRVTAFNELNPNIRARCLYISGESPNVYDHLRCYQGGQWVTYNLPSNVSSRSTIPGINWVGGHYGISIRTYDHISKQLKYFRMVPELGQVIGYLDRSIRVKQGLILQGWACQQRMHQSIDLHVYLGNTAYSGQGRLIAASKANLSNEQAVNNRCKTRGNFRFSFVIPKKLLEQHAGKRIYVHGIKKESYGPGRNNAIDRSGQFRVPRF